MSEANVPPLGLMTRCRLERVVDGDTVEVTVERSFMVRLIDCWAPETRGSEHVEGEAAREQLKRLVSPGDELLLHVPASADGELGDVLTFGRVLGKLWRPGDRLDLSARMVASGHAKAKKADAVCHSGG